MLNTADPLVPVPITLEGYVGKALTTEPDRDVMELMSEYFGELSIQMPAFDTVGNPLTPPDTHVLDHLARAWGLVDEEIAAQRPTAGTVACPIEDLECELCGDRARYEIYLRVRGERTPVYACLDCARTHGDGILGSGESVYLMHTDEIPPTVRETCDAIRTQLGQQSIWAGDDEDTEPDPIPVDEAPPAEPVVLSAPAVSARLRWLWINRVGPLLEASDHDLSESWLDATVRRLGPRLLVSTPINFGDGDPFDGPVGDQIRQLVADESSGAVDTVTHEYGGPTVARQRRPKATNLDIFSAGGGEAPDSATVAHKLSVALAGATPVAAEALAKLTVAGVSRHRVWLAVPTEAARKAIGSTPGAAADLAIAIAKLQKAEALYDIVVDPGAASRYPKVVLD